MRSAWMAFTYVSMDLRRVRILKVGFGTYDENSSVVLIIKDQYSAFGSTSSCRLLFLFLVCLLGRVDRRPQGQTQ
jgi:hypothetical protein